MTPPNRAYYLRHVGRWRGVFDWRVTDADALRRQPMPWIDRLGVRSLELGRWLPGTLHLHTSVEVLPGAEPDADHVVHTTRLTRAGVTVLHGSERISLGADGWTFTMRGSHRALPVPWRPQAFEGTGEIDESATRATYRFAFLGVPMTQATEASDEGLHLVQTTAFSSATVLLRRL